MLRSLPRSVSESDIALVCAAMLGRVVSTVRKKINNTLKTENRKNSWHNLIKWHNERNVTILSDFERINYRPAVDERDVNPCLLKVSQLSNSVTIEDIAYVFGSAVMIRIEKSRTHKMKTAYVGYDSETESIKAFIACHQTEVKGLSLVVTFADVYFDKRNVAEVDKY